MIKLSLLSATAIGSVASLAMIAATPAMAQSTTTTQEVTPPIVKTPVSVAPTTVDDASTNPNDAIVVTGSRIRRPNLDSVVPVTSIAGESFFERGQTNIGDALNDLPQLRSTFAQQNPGLGVGIAGLNLLDLRGLGTSRTLVLVNGRRHVPADILNNAVSPDVNSIPNDLIERVDIVTGGNSAVYGSDAIAGVVNFILRRDYNGVQIRGNAAVTARGFGGNQYVSAMAGKNFADGRGNVTLHGEYSHQDRIFASDIPWYRSVDGLGVIDVDTAGLPNNSDGFPDRTFFRDFRSASINRFGLVPITQNSSLTANTNPLCGRGLGQTDGPGGPGSGSTAGTAYNCTFVFTPGGQLTPQTGTRFGTGIIGSIIGGNGQTGREDHLVSVLPYQQRVNFNLLAHYTVADAFEPFIEAKWNRVDTLGSNAGPSFIQGTFSQFDFRERVRLDNPFLSAADRSTIAGAILASGCKVSLTAVCTTTPRPGQATNLLTATDIAAINAGTYRFVDARSLADSGIRDEQFRRDTYRIVAGAKGTFNTDWNYEISANYGKFKENTTTYGYLNKQRFVLSLDSGRNPATGQIQCRSQFDPTAAVAFAGQDANLASDIAACVPYNPFGAGDNSAAAKYFTYNARDQASLSQFDALGFVNGDSSQLFSLPGGPISFVVGGEYRAEKARYHNDPFIEAGATNAVNVGEFTPPTTKVKELFGELQVPLLKDLPFAHELSFSGAGRVSKYKGLDQKIYTYNYGGVWSPIRDLRFRANYGKAVRAPNVSETGFPAVANFAPGFSDPCAGPNIAANANRVANCTSDLGSLLGGLPTSTYSLAIISGSNPNLKPETSKSLTIGGVIQPRFIPGFSLSVDYYNIKVSNIIVSLAAQTIANSCYDQPTLNNPFCAVFSRYRGAGTGPLGEQPGQILGNSLVSAPVNFAKRVRRGIDVTANYGTRLSSNVRLNGQLIYVHGLTSSNFESTTNPTFENRILSELGDPKDEARLDLDLTVGAVTFGYRAHYIGPMYVNAFEDFNGLNGVGPGNLDYADIRKYPAIVYNDARIEWNIKGNGISKEMKLSLGVDNIFDKHPPLGSTGTGSGSAIYDIRGRNLYAGVRARF